MADAVARGPNGLNFLPREVCAMDALVAKVRAFLKDEEGLTIVEYAVAGGLITATVVTTFTLLGETVEGIISTINERLGG
jgi:pilus assembly protein Flp/PilA